MLDAVDWNALAAEVLANFEATGKWFASGAPPSPEPVDWNALAAEALANFEATGQWFVSTERSTTPLEPPPPEATIRGTDGPDRLQETLGRDVFWGGPGADGFSFGIGIFHDIYLGEYFESVLGTGVGPEARDVILDFQQGEDVIDLSAALQFARKQMQNNLAFDFIGTAGFSGTPDGRGTAQPELRYEVSSNRTIIGMDGRSSGTGAFYGDGVVDAEIELVGVFSLTGSDFIL